MNKLAAFRAFGVRPVPHTPPQVFMKTAKSGKRFKTALKDKSLVEWQMYVAEFAKDAMRGATPSGKPVWAQLDFTFRHDSENQHGRLCLPDVVWNAKKKEWVKKGPSVPDVDNLSKAVLDAIQGVVFLNDVQVCSLLATRYWGPDDEVKVRVWEYADDDMPYLPEDLP